MNYRWTFLFPILLWTMVACHQARLATLPGSDLAQSSTTNDTNESYWKLLDALGTCPGTTLIREYVERGFVGRQYSTDLPLGKGAETVDVFYHRKILARRGWKVLDHHAAISSYVKGNQLFCIIRSGPVDPGLTPGALLRKSVKPPASAKFFFRIEAGPRPE